MMFEKLGVQAYTFRDAYAADDANEKTLDAVFRALKQMGYDELQTAGFGNIGMEAYARLAQENGLAIVGTHYDYQEMCTDIDEVMRKHKEILHTSIMGIGNMPKPARQDREELFRFIDRFNKIGDAVHPYGFKLSYHNHDFEFVRLDDGKTVMDHLCERLNPETTSFCLDTHWVQRGGGNPTTWVEKLAGRIDILHLKDMAVIRQGEEIVPLITEIGSGNIDFDSVITAAVKGGVKYYCVEQDECPGDPLDSLRKSIEYIKPRYMI